MTSPVFNSALNAAEVAPAQAKQEDADPSELWLALTALPRPSRVVPFPRTVPGTKTPVCEVAIWPLTQEEQMAANAEADRFTKRLLKDPQQKDQANLGYHHTYTNEVALQVLYRACRVPGDLGKPAFLSPNAMRKEFTTDEVGVLFNHYLTTQGEVGPIVSQMSPEECDALILRIAASGSAVPFDSLSWEQQRALVTSMASQCVACWTDMFSAGLPLDASTYAQDQIRRLVEAGTEAVARESAEAEATPTQEPPTPPTE